DGEGDGIEIDAVLSRLGFSSRADLKLMHDTERKELKKRLHSVLTPEQRVIVDLLMDGCHCFEICAMLDIKRQALESRLKKIGKRIRPVMKEWRKSSM
ncbi:hypothetical protein LJC40_03075, partial [Synergistaceae bacterium OttesenSCG-928-D05]|nr:hypothetical protein [Synergistaceae bacterium OttesenSCG-928-D05]